MARLRTLFLLIAAALLASAPAMAAGVPDVVLGNPKAKVTVIEYASLSCPHCARFNAEVFPAFKKKFIDTGKVKYIFREFLTEPVELSATGALLARCAGPGKFFTVADIVFAGQQEVYDTGQLKPVLMRAGKAAGLTEAQVVACVTDKDAQDALEKRVEHYVNDLKIDATPTFVINGKHYVGEQSLDDLGKAITGK